MPREVTAWRRARWAIETGGALTIERIARLVPRAAVIPLGSAIGRAAYAIDRRHRRIAIDNLGQAFGASLSPGAQRALVRRSFAHFGRVAVECLRFGGMTRDSANTLAHVEGLEHLHAAYARGRGVLICGAHFGNWELHGLLQGWLGYPLAVVARPLDNPGLDRVFARLRGRSGNTIIDKGWSLQTISRALRQGRAVAVLVDQRPKRSGVVVPFFGRPALTSPGPALLALRTGAALLPAYSVPQSDGTYRCVYEPEIPVIRTGDVAVDVTRLTRLYTDTVERWIRQHPDAWLWMHNRWKAPGPPGRGDEKTPTPPGKG